MAKGEFPPRKSVCSGCRVSGCRQHSRGSCSASAVREELFSSLSGEQEVPGIQHQFGSGYLWRVQQLELCYADFMVLQSDLCKDEECLIAATQQVCSEVVPGVSEVGNPRYSLGRVVSTEAKFVRRGGVPLPPLEF